jgi:ribonuclease P protein component
MKGGFGETRNPRPRRRAPQKGVDVGRLAKFEFLVLSRFAGAAVADDLSFSKARRLTRTAEFDWVRKEGKVWRGTLITLAVVIPPEVEKQTRVGIIASRRVGGAVIRNQTRRRIREIFRKQQHNIQDGVWVVAILSARAARAGYAELEDEWLRLAGRASILKP